MYQTEILYLDGRTEIIMSSTKDEADEVELEYTFTLGVADIITEEVI